MEIFKFEKNDITKFIEYELKIFDKFKEPLNYVIKGLDKLGNSMTIKSLDKKINLNKVKEKEGKNYHWSVFIYKNATLVVRRYRHHLTIYSKVIKENEYNGRKRLNIEYGAFTLDTNFDKFGELCDKMSDEYSDKPFTDLNIIIKDLFKLIIDRDCGVHWVWNSASLKRPDHIDIKLIFDNKNITSLDDFVFCMEELSEMYLVLFAESTMIQKLKEYQIQTDKSFNSRYKIGDVITEVKDEYYHGVGMYLVDLSDDNKKGFNDVYCLTRYYFNYIFKKSIYIYEGEIYIEGGEFEIGKPVAIKDWEYFDNVTLLKETSPKENFIPLIKY